MDVGDQLWITQEAQKTAALKKKIDESKLRQEQEKVSLEIQKQTALAQEQIVLQDEVKDRHQNARHRKTLMASINEAVVAFKQKVGKPDNTHRPITVKRVSRADALSSNLSSEVIKQKVDSIEEGAVREQSLQPEIRQGRPVDNSIKAFIKERGLYFAVPAIFAGLISLGAGNAATVVRNSTGAGGGAVAISLWVSNNERKRNHRNEPGYMAAIEELYGLNTAAIMTLRQLEEMIGDFKQEAQDSSTAIARQNYVVEEISKLIDQLGELATGLHDDIDTLELERIHRVIQMATERIGKRPDVVSSEGGITAFSPPNVMSKPTETENEDAFSALYR